MILYIQMMVVFLIFMFVIGAGMGSFLACQARRLYLLQHGGKKLGKWSVCLSCKHKLAWFENIPIFSWLFLRGKCRKCGKKIGYLEILSEVLCGLSFLAISLWVDFDMVWFGWVQYVLILLFVLSLAFLAIYDGMCGELPNFALIINIVIGFLIFVCTMFADGWSMELLIQLLISVAVLFAVYFALSRISKGAWVGDGDAFIGLGIAFVLASGWLSVWVLFLSNTLGCIFAMIVGKRKKDSKIYFGPFLAIAFVLVYVLQFYLEGLL